jgi:hypothetical protein
MRTTTLTIATLLFGGFAMLAACGDDDDDAKGGAGATGSPEQTGTICKAASDCFPKIDVTTLKGAVECLTQVKNGYCTHLCESDADCCAVPGECETNLKQVCSPFESTGKKMCFLSCESADLVTASGEKSTSVDEQEFCQREASTAFICRSSGGGSENRKVCVPGDCGVGAGCADDTGCDVGQTCAQGFRGGYCTKQGCAANTDCPKDSVCSTVGSSNICVKQCSTNTDCAFCRSGDTSTTCKADAKDITGQVTSACVPAAR